MSEKETDEVEIKMRLYPAAGVEVRQVVRVEFKDEGACHRIMEANPEAKKYFAHGEYGTVEINVRTLACRLVAPGEG